MTEKEITKEVLDKKTEKTRKRRAPYKKEYAKKRTDNFVPLGKNKETK